MAHVLVHIHSGPDLPSKATLGGIVAVTAARAGHQVTVFLAGDGVHLLAPQHADITAPGTGRMGDHLVTLRDLGATIRVSRLSSLARGYDDSLLAPHTASFALPEDLIALSLAADSTLCY
jgi:predicted peroxiredoxin